MPVMQVSSSENRVGAVLAAQGLHQFQVAARGRRQFDALAVAHHLQLLHVRQRAALRVFGVGEQGGRGGVRVRQVFGAPGATGWRPSAAPAACAGPGRVELPLGRCVIGTGARRPAGAARRPA
jgi:hypothetical protein